MKRIVEYHKLRPKEAVKLRKECPVAYIGLGILEWHGLHNPLGLDAVKANGIGCFLAKRLGGLVMPPQFWADDRSDICELVLDPLTNPNRANDPVNHTQEICRIMEIEKESFQKCGMRNKGWKLWIDLMVHTLFEIESLGFLGIISIPGHYPLFGPLDSAIDEYKARGGKSSVFVLKDTMFSEDGKSGDHAAAFETSLMLALYPDLVDLSLLDTDPNIGVVGKDPRLHASREFGLEILGKFEALVSDFYRESLGLLLPKEEQ